MKLSRKVKVFVISGCCAVGCAFALPSLADDSPIDVLKTETGKVTGIFDSLVAPAVGSTVFAIGAVLVKRIAFS